MNKKVITTLFAGLWLLSAFPAGICYCQDTASGNWPTVGIESSIEISLPRGDLSPMGVKDRTDLILRVASVRPQDGGYIYDLRYIGLLPGDYNLSSYLLMPDGISPPEGLPAVAVKVLPLLPQGHHDLVSKQLKAHMPPGGYKLFFTIVCVAWAALVLPLIFAFREKKQVVVEKVVRPATLAELLRPLVEKALVGELDASGKGHLERLLMGYWQKELKLDEASIFEMLQKIKQHPEGGKLIEKLEYWLHRPPEAGSVDIDELLSPYKKISAASVEQEVAK